MAVSYKVVDGSYVGATVLTNEDATQLFPIGTIVRGLDTSTSAYGEAEFTYVKFTGNVVAGDFVLYDVTGKTCVQSPAATANGTYGIAMATHASAATTAVYGWVMIRGTHDGANVTTGKTAGTILTGSATAGRASSAVANYILDGVIERNTAASNIGTVFIYYPMCSGR